MPLTAHFDNIASGLERYGRVVDKVVSDTLTAIAKDASAAMAAEAGKVFDRQDKFTLKGFGCTSSKANTKCQQVVNGDVGTVTARLTFVWFSSSA